MAEIYRKAHKVVAWLGPAESDDDSVMDYLNSLGAKAEACGMDHGFEPFQEVWQELALQPREFRDHDQRLAWGLNILFIGLVQYLVLVFYALIKSKWPSTVTPAGKIFWYRKDALHSIFYSISGWHDQDKLLPISGMKRFFTRPWWGRIWVLQEITLPENAEFLCGSKRITRRRCAAAFHAYCALRSILCTRFMNEPQSFTRYQLDIISNLFQHRPTLMLDSWKVYRYSRFPLVALLRATCVGSTNLDRHGPHNLDSTDPRDKIFALLGLAADREDLEKLGVSPDYSKSCEEIYTTTMVALLQQGHLSLLSFCRTSKIQPNLVLPSWVPDWSRSVTHMLQDVRNDHVTLYPEFSASGVQSCHPKVTAIKREGAVKGISLECYVYDQIYEVGSFTGRASSHEVPLLETFSWPVEWLVELLRLTYEVKQFYVDFSDRLHAAARTSIGGVGYSPKAELVRVGDDRFLDALVLLGNNIKRIKVNRIKHGLQRLLNDGVVKGQIKSRATKSLNLGNEIIGKSLGRLPFITRKGHLALGPEYVKRGDDVALIRGTQVPFILRRQSNGQYQLIGEVYVDRIMDGEAMDKSKWCEVTLV